MGGSGVGVGKVNTELVGARVAEGTDDNVRRRQYVLTRGSTKTIPSITTTKAAMTCAPLSCLRPDRTLLVLRLRIWRKRRLDSLGDLKSFLLRMSALPDGTPLRCWVTLAQFGGQEVNQRCVPADGTVSQGDRAEILQSRMTAP